MEIDIITTGEVILFFVVTVPVGILKLYTQLQIIKERKRINKEIEIESISIDNSNKVSITINNFTSSQTKVSLFEIGYDQNYLYYLLRKYILGFNRYGRDIFLQYDNKNKEDVKQISPNGEISFIIPPKDYKVIVGIITDPRLQIENIGKWFKRPLLVYAKIENHHYLEPFKLTNMNISFV